MSPRERVCPSCSAPAGDEQRWCVECGAELPSSSLRAGMRPAVGIATTLAVLVGAASAGGYTVLQDDRQPPPPAKTVAQEPPPVTTTPDDGSGLSSDTSPFGATPRSSRNPPGGRGSGRSPSAGGGFGGSDFGGSGGFSGGGGFGGGSTPTYGDVPDLSGQVDTSTPNEPPPDQDAGELTPGDGEGSVEDQPRGGGDGQAGDGKRRTDGQSKPRMRETNIALGTVAIVYPPAASDQNLGDAAAAVDGATRTAWKTPSYRDPSTSPQLGLYVDLVGREKLTKLVVRSPTPGLKVEVYGARSGPPRTITGAGWKHLTSKTLAGTSTIELPAGATYRYVLLWVTALPPGGNHGAISELEVFSRKPV